MESNMEAPRKYQPAQGAGPMAHGKT